MVGVFWFLGLRSCCVCKQEYFQQKILQLCMLEWSAVNSHNNLILSGFLGFRKLLLTPAVFPCTLTEYSTSPFQRHFTAILAVCFCQGSYVAELADWANDTSQVYADPAPSLPYFLPSHTLYKLQFSCKHSLWHHCQPQQCQRRSPGRQTDKGAGDRRGTGSHAQPWISSLNWSGFSTHSKHWFGMPDKAQLHQWDTRTV